MSFAMMNQIGSRAIKSPMTLGYKVQTVQNRCAAMTTHVFNHLS